MRTITRWTLVVLVGIAATGCDPFEKATGGTPAAIGAIFTDVGGLGGSCSVTGCTPYDGTGAGSTWTISGVASYCSNNTPGLVDVNGLISVKFNKLLDGYAIQATPSDCTPTAALNLSVTPAPPAGLAWYACYFPQAPAPTEGSSVVIFMDSATAPPAGWNQAKGIPGNSSAVVSYHVTGRVHDKGGASADFDVTTTIDPNPGVPGNPTYTYGAGPSVIIAWTAADCGGAATYAVERAPNVPTTATPPVDAPGAWSALAGAGAVAGLTFTDSTVTAGTKYWYRVTAKTATGGFTGATSKATMATVP